MKTCRACLSTDVEMVKMDRILLHNFNTITGLTVKFCDELPFYTCKLCLDGITFCIQFKNKCIESDLAWNKIKIQETKPIKNQTTITIEPTTFDFNNILLPIKKEEKYETEDSNDCFEYSYDEFIHENKDEVESKNIRRSNRCKNKAVVKENKVESKPRKKNNKHKTKPIVKDEKSLFLCGLCVLKFDDKSSLSEHLETHKNDMQCERCQESFINLAHLLSHRFEHLTGSQNFCHICYKKFLTIPSLEFHYMKKHEMCKENELIACKICFRKFSKKKTLLNHIASRHSDLYKCELCDKGYGAKHFLRRHMKTHSLVNTYKCELCDYSSRHRSGLRAHIIRKHTEGRCYCNYCKRVFRSRAERDNHTCKYMKYKICPVCGLTIAGDDTRLKNHMMMHDDIPRFECDHCSARLRTKKTLKLHLERHAGKPKHQCSYCQRKFYRSGVLTKHIRVHTGEKPYVCKICSRGFTGNHNLKVHMKVHGITNLIKKKDKTDVKN